MKQLKNDVLSNKNEIYRRKIRECPGKATSDILDANCRIDRIENVY